MKKYNNGNFTIKDVEKNVELYGWVHKIRKLGGMIFVLLRDKTGLIQLVFNENTQKEIFALAENLKNEYCLKVNGVIIKRTPAMINKNMPTGEVEIAVEELEILNTCETLPFNIFEDADANENIALKYRYLQLRKDKYQNILKLRHQVTKSIRDYLDNLGFTEIETPILCKSTPEGARDYVVPSRINKGAFYALPQSPQIFKQLLMIAGFEKYYQIAKCFRDEDLRADRQPEFTQIDLEMSFAVEEDVFEVAEGMLKYIFKETKNIVLPKFPRIKYDDAITIYGTDKPDTRFEMHLKDITDVFSNTNFKMFQDIIADNGIIKCIVVNHLFSHKEIDNLTIYAKSLGAKGLISINYINNEFNGSVVKNIEKDKLDFLKTKLNLQNNDTILIVADKKKVVNATLGGLRNKIAKELNLIPDNMYNFLWITDFPMFEYSETENKWMAAHHPFTMPNDVKLMTDPEHCYARSYDIVVNGYELASGSVRIHDQSIQSQVFDALGISKEEAKNKFGFFLEAFQYGAPPHAGIAPGIDRIVMILTGTDNIKDVIAFPKIQSAADLMNECPSSISERQLKELGLKVVDDEK